MFLNEPNEVKIKMFEDFRVDCIYNSPGDDWDGFYKSYKDKYYSE